MIFSSTSFWQSGIKVQRRLLSCLGLISHRQKHWVGMEVFDAALSQDIHSSFQHHHQCWCLHAAKKMRDNSQHSRDGRKPSLQPKKLLAVLQGTFDDFIQLCSFSCISPLGKEMPLRPARERVRLQYCQMGNRGVAVPPTLFLTCGHRPYGKDLFTPLSWNELGFSSIQPQDSEKTTSSHFNGRILHLSQLQTNLPRPW